MIPELGHFALIVALLLALTLGTLGLAGAQRARPDWMALARPLALGQALCVALAWMCLVQAFVANDFSLRNVAENSTTLLPLRYRVAAAWGSHEGSMLLWLLMQSLWLLALRRGTRALPASVAARVLGVMGLVAAGLLLFVLFSSNPFLRLFPIPAEGRDLNPLLQDPGMVLHPPLLYLGYTGFSIPFAFALAALLDRCAAEGAAWARWSRPWTAAAWAGLTLGVAVGSWWAYTELGWGGWWFWDPVENAAFMPWLLGTALLHALAVAARRQLFQPWTALLAIATFALSLLGTFLVRSGVLSSVHAFAIDPRRGIFILALLLAVAGGSLALFARRGAALGGGGAFDPVSRETALLAGTLLLAVACGTVMLGTFYPLAMEVLGLARVSVGAPYFEAVFVPLMLPLLLLAGLGPALRWQRGAAAWRRLLPALGLALAVGATAAGLAGASWRVALGLALAAWLPLAAATTGRRPGLAGWALWLAHGGLALFVTGVALVRGLETERDLRLAPGERAAVGAFELRFDGVTPVPGPNYEAERGRFELLPAGPTLWPEKRRYTSMAAGNATTEAAIASSLAGDIYIALGQPDGDAGAWTLRVYHKPFVGWIWAGCGLMVLGGAVAAVARRRQG